MTRKIGCIVAAIALASMLTACSSGDNTDDQSPAADQATEEPQEPAAEEPEPPVEEPVEPEPEAQTLSVAGLEGGYGVQLYQDAAAAFEALNPGVTVNLQFSKTVEDEIGPGMQAGQFPDVVVLGQGREAGLTETMIKDQALEDLTDVLSMTIPGESGTVSDKLIDGIVGSLGTNPYADERTFLMPLNYSPTGLVYDIGLFETKGWELPATWDDMWALGDAAKAEDISLFTYPTAGYMDSYFNSLLAGVGGEDFFRDVATYAEGVWERPEAKEAIDLTTRLLTEYANPDTVGYANQQDFTRNQQSVLDDKSIFMPNGTWIDGEMADAPRPDHFQWGLAPLPAVSAGGERFITTSIETAWIPSGAANKDLAKQFIAFLYSDTAVQAFAASNAIQPVKGVSSQLPENLVGFYEVYDAPGVKALVGGFASTPPVEGVSIQETLYDTANSIITGDKSAEEWLSELNEASEALRAAAATAD
jgi:N-acetylglucosamine transport system substrate-binding protein